MNLLVSHRAGAGAGARLWVLSFCEHKGPPRLRPHPPTSKHRWGLDACVCMRACVSVQYLDSPGLGPIHILGKCMTLDKAFNSAKPQHPGLQKRACIGSELFRDNTGSLCSSLYSAVCRPPSSPLRASPAMDRGPTSASSPCWLPKPANQTPGRW